MPTLVLFREVPEASDRTFLAQGAVPAFGVPAVSITPSSPHQQEVERGRDKQAGKSKGWGDQIGHCCWG